MTTPAKTLTISQANWMFNKGLAWEYGDHDLCTPNAIYFYIPPTLDSGGNYVDGHYVLDC